MAHKCVDWLCAVLGSPMLHTKSEVAHKWVDWLCHPCQLGAASHRWRKLAMTHKRVEWLCQNGGPNQKQPTSGRIGYIPTVVWGAPKHLELGK